MLALGAHLLMLKISLGLLTKAVKSLGSGWMSAEVYEKSKTL